MSIKNLFYPNDYDLNCESMKVDGAFLYRRLDIGQLVDTTATDLQFITTVLNNKFTIGLTAPFNATYKGDRAIKALISVSANFIRQSVGDSNVFLGVYINGSMLDGKAGRVSGGTATADWGKQTISFNCIASLNPDDVISVKIVGSAVCSIEGITVGGQTSRASSFTLYELPV